MADRIENFAVNSARWLSLEDFEGEVWKDIPDYEGWYQVSNMGRVKSVGRYRVQKGKSTAFVRSRILRCGKRSGYNRIGLCVNSITKYFNIHRIVASTFISNEKNLPEVDHINTIRTDNRVCNLRWVSHIGNSYNEKTIKITANPVLLYENNTIVAQFSSVKAAARILKIHENVLRDMINHKWKNPKRSLDLRYKYPAEKRIGNNQQ